MFKVGVTGGIGSGKSVVCRIFELLGVPVYDADARAKYLMTDDDELKTNIERAFGEEAYLSEGALNRIFLANNVFANPDKLRQLNNLVHPVVGRDFQQLSDSQTAKYIIKEAALLVETGSYKALDKLIVVTAPEKVRISRVLMRDEHRSLQQIRSIIQNQYPESEKTKCANYLVNNDESHLIFPQIFKIHTKIIDLSI